MKTLFNYIAFRVFEFFNRKDKDLAIMRTISFLSILEISLAIPIFLIIKLFVENDSHKIFSGNFRMKYSIAIPIAMVLIAFTNIVFSKKLKGTKFEELFVKYHSDKYKLPIWIILIAPIFFIIVCPIIFGIIKGTLQFPIFEK